MDESFWKDVTTRTLAAAIVGLCAYLYALGAGYLSTPSGWQAAKGLFTTVVPFAVSLLGAWIGWRFRGTAVRNNTFERRLNKAAAAFLVLMAVLVVLVTIDYFFGLPFWPFDDEVNFPTK